MLISTAAPKPPINSFADIEHVVMNHWLWLLLMLIVLVQYFLLKHSLKQIAACLIGFLAFLIHHTTSVFQHLAALLRTLANELEKSDRLDRENAKSQDARP